MELLERVGGDREAARQLTALFLEQGPQLVAAVGTALAQREAGPLERAAHSLRGTLSSLAAPAAAAAALQLELLGQDGRVDGADEAFARLEQDIDRLRAALAAWGKELA